MTKTGYVGLRVMGGSTTTIIDGNSFTDNGFGGALSGGIFFSPNVGAMGSLSALIANPEFGDNYTHVTLDMGIVVAHQPPRMPIRFYGGAGLRIQNSLLPVEDEFGSNQGTLGLNGFGAFANVGLLVLVVPTLGLDINLLGTTGVFNSVSFEGETERLDDSWGTRGLTFGFGLTRIF